MKNLDEFGELDPRFRLLVEQAPAISYIAALDDASTTLYVSPQVEAMLGYTQDEYAADPDMWRRLLHPEDRERVLAEVRASHASGEPFRSEYRMLARDGREVWFRDEAVIVEDAAGRRLLQGIMLDITAHKRMEEELRDSEAQFRDLYENAPNAYFSVGVDGHIRRCNRRAGELLGYAANELVGRPVLELYADTPQGKEKAQEVFQRFRAGETVVDEALQMQRADGTPVWISLTVNAVRDARGEVVESRSIVVDITQRVQAQEALQTLSRRLVDAQEMERRTIVRELHDEIGQALTGLKLSLETIAPAPAEGVEGRLEEAHRLIGELMAQVRDLSLDLRPAIQDDLGLLPALLWHFERYTAQTDIHVRFQQSGLDRRFSPDVETAAYRIVQEALTNVARHANVSNVGVQLWTDEDVLVVQVEDRGTGFDPETALDSGSSSGLAGMRDRATVLGGQLTVESTPGGGTRLKAELPLGQSGQGIGTEETCPAQELRGFFAKIP